MSDAYIATRKITSHYEFVVLTRISATMSTFVHQYSVKREMNLTQTMTKFSNSSRYRDIMVVMESVVSGHQFNKIRERLGDKLEIIRFDPYSKLMEFFISENRLTANFVTIFQFRKCACIANAKRSVVCKQCGD